MAVPLPLVPWLARPDQSARLLIRRGVHLNFHGFERLHLRLERGDLVLKADRVGRRQFDVLTIRRLQRCHVAFDAGLDLLHPPLD